MATKLSQKKPWCKFMMMMMTFMKVKGHQRLNVVNVALMVTKLGHKRIPDASLHGDDLHEGQRSSEVKCGKLCTMVNLVNRIANASFK